MAYSRNLRICEPRRGTVCERDTLGLVIILAAFLGCAMIGVFIQLRTGRKKEDPVRSLGAEELTPSGLDHIYSISLVILTCLLLANFLAYVIARTPLYQPPVTVVIFLFGIFISSSIDWTKVRTTTTINPNDSIFLQGIILLQHSSPLFIFYGLLPIVLYEAASEMNYYVFKRVLPTSLLLAWIGVVINLALVAVFSKYAFIWSWPLSLVTGSILSATDPVAVITSLSQLKAPEKLSAVIDGESLLNDGSAVVFFEVFRDLLVNEFSGFGSAIVDFLRLSVGGAAWGLAMGIVMYVWSMTFTGSFIIQVTGTVSLAYWTFFSADYLLRLSGVMATVTYGVFVAARGRVAMNRGVQHAHKLFVEVLSIFAVQIIFLLGGIISYRFFHISYTKRTAFWASGGGWLEIFVMYVVLHICRYLVVWGGVPVFKLTGLDMNWKEVTVIGWSGLRGIIALALILLIESDNRIERDEVLACSTLVCGVVLLTIVVNGISMEFLYKYLKMYPVRPFRQRYLCRVLKEIEAEYDRTVQDEVRWHWLFGCEPLVHKVDQLVPCFEYAAMDEMGRIRCETFRPWKVLRTLRSDLARWGKEKEKEEKAATPVRPFLQRLRTSLTWFSDFSGEGVDAAEGQVRRASIWGEGGEGGAIGLSPVSSRRVVQSPNTDQPKMQTSRRESRELLRVGSQTLMPDHWFGFLMHSAYPDAKEQVVDSAQSSSSNLRQQLPETRSQMPRPKSWEGEWSERSPRAVEEVHGPSRQWNIWESSISGKMKQLATMETGDGKEGMRERGDGEEKEVKSIKEDEEEEGFVHELGSFNTVRPAAATQLRRLSISTGDGGVGRDVHLSSMLLNSYYQIYIHLYHHHCIGGNALLLLKNARDVARDCGDRLLKLGVLGGDSGSSMLRVQWESLSSSVRRKVNNRFYRFIQTPIFDLRFDSVMTAVQCLFAYADAKAALQRAAGVNFEAAFPVTLLTDFNRCVGEARDLLKWVRDSDRELYVYALAILVGNILMNIKEEILIAHTSRGLILRDDSMKLVDILESQRRLLSGYVPPIRWCRKRRPVEESTDQEKEESGS